MTEPKIDSKPGDRTRLAAIPLRNMVLFPGVVQPIDVGRPRSMAVAERVEAQHGLRIAVVTQRSPEVDEPALSDIFPIAVEAEVLRVMKVAANRATIVVRGVRRLRVHELDTADGALHALCEPLVEVRADEVEAQGLAMAVRDAAKQIVAISPDIPDEAGALLDQIRDPARMGDVAAANIEGTTAEKMELLELLDVPQRLREVLTRLQRALETYRVKEHIDSHVRAEMGRHQREAVLRQRLRAIQEELGDADDDDGSAEFEERLRAIEMPAEVREVAEKQVVRMRQIPTQSPEHTVARTYLEWLVELPWSTMTPDDLDLDHARRILDEDHYGLDRVKKRIVEYLAVRKLKPDKKGPILCLVGPPGVGKTSTGRSVARALGRKFVRASLGGVRDEAEIRGHRRTYVGALPGRIIQGIRRAGTRNPVFVLDEIDKLGRDFRGDPSSALLEVLDPEQNDTFSDHFLEVPFDLSQVLFFATANEIDPIPPALKDRLEVIDLPGYTRNEKLHIARRHLIPKQLEEHGLAATLLQHSAGGATAASATASAAASATASEAPPAAAASEATTEGSVALTVLEDTTVLHVADHYTREAGVRNLERELASICRGLAVRVASDRELPSTVTPQHLLELLGPVKYYPEAAERTEITGVATGLAWTSSGGELMFVEATRMPGKGKLILTGQLGEVMQESAQAALSYARTKAVELGLEVDFFAESDLHLHVPAGGIKKDGPSAGMTMVAALVSLLSGRRVRDDLAMTGEISLRGTVMPVGGVKEKVLAAHRAGLRRVLLPERNRKDLIDVPKEIQVEMELLFVNDIAQALALALEATPRTPRKKRSRDPVVPDTAAHSAA
ncbi:MAG: LON peptidase substrate-binding domain-containing protein [Proteobacteria bacterium]|nr:LON peptidase substrate-binding domain-containing protein [Pseudomonadota bacterium]